MNAFGRFRNPEAAANYSKDRARNGINEQYTQMPLIILLAIINLIVTYCTKKSLNEQAVILLIWNLTNFTVIVLTFLFSLKYETPKNYLFFDFLYACRQVSAIILAFYALSNTTSNLVLFSVKFLVCSVLVMNIIISTFFRICFFLGCMIFIFWQIRHIPFSIWYVQIATETFILVMMCILKEIADRRVFHQKYREMKNGDTLRFILNEIPESIVIVNKKLEEKYANTRVYRMFEADTNTEMLDIFKKVTDISVRDCFSELSIQVEPPRTLFDLKRTSDGTDLSTFCTINYLKNHDLFDLIKKNKEKPSGTLIVDGKYQRDEPGSAPSSIEIKMSAATFLEEECIIFIFRDTTKRDLIAQLQGDNTYKDSLLASVSHEFRTPLNGVLNFVEASIDDSLTPEPLKQKYLTPALSSGKILQHIINDFLDHSQIKAGKLRLVYGENSLRKTCEQCISLLKLQCKKKGIDLRHVYKNNVQENFSTDHNRLSQIILNLLNNALKFTSQGHIEVLVEKMDSFVKVSVTDSGIGISPENQQNLFQKFSKIDLGKDMHLNSTGVGLGLSIATTLAKLLGPEDSSGIHLESTPGVGSTFSFTIAQRDQEGKLIHYEVQETSMANLNISDDLSEPHDRKQIYDTLETITFSSVKNTLSTSPSDEKNTRILKAGPSNFQSLQRYLVQMKETDNNAPMHSGRQGSMRKLSNSCSQNSDGVYPKILIVDDDGFNIMVLENLCESLGLKTDSAFNGKEAVDKVMQREEEKRKVGCKQYEIIFMDCTMPIMDGLEATRKIKGLGMNEIKVIGCTGYSCDTSMKSCKECGMSDVMTKPVNREKLDGIVKKYMKNDVII